MNCDSDADDTETILPIKNIKKPNQNQPKTTKKERKGNAKMLSIHYGISDELIS